MRLLNIFGRISKIINTSEKTLRLLTHLFTHANTHRHTYYRSGALLFCEDHSERR